MVNPRQRELEDRISKMFESMLYTFNQSTKPYDISLTKEIFIEDFKNSHICSIYASRRYYDFILKNSREPIIESGSSFRLNPKLNGQKIYVANTIFDMPIDPNQVAKKSGKVR
jgi:hypothetical protein